MARLNWDQIGDRFYETGVDRGVLYTGIEVAGVAWNGLISVAEEVSGGEEEELFYDGRKYRNLVGSESFQGTIEAFSSPPEFELCDGMRSVAKGLLVTNQPRRSFGLCYRTMIGNDIRGLDFGYKLHLIYNALASPATKTNQTTGDSPEAATRSWTIRTVPPNAGLYKATAHLVVDSTKTDPSALQALEATLYGDETNNPVLPTQQAVISVLGV